MTDNGYSSLPAGADDWAKVVNLIARKVSPRLQHRQGVRVTYPNRNATCTNRV